MAKPLPAGVSFYLDASSLKGMVLLHCEFGERPQDASQKLISGIYPLSHLIQPLLIWAPPAEELCPWVHSSQQQGSHTSQTAPGISGSWPKTPPEDSEMWCSWPWKCHSFSGEKPEVPSAKCLESRAVKASPSWVCLQPLLPAIHLHVLSWSSPWFSETPCLTTLQE